MRTEERIEAVAAQARASLAGLAVKRPAQGRNVLEASWGEMPVHAAFFPLARGLPAEAPETVPSVLVMPLRGEQGPEGEWLRWKLLASVYEPGDRVDLKTGVPVAAGDLRDAGAGWRALLGVLDRLRQGFASGMRVAGSDLWVQEIKWSLYTEEGLIPDLRPFYCGWVDVLCGCAQPASRSAEVAALLR